MSLSFLYWTTNVMFWSIQFYNHNARKKGNDSDTLNNFLILGKGKLHYLKEPHRNNKKNNPDKGEHLNAIPHPTNEGYLVQCTSGHSNHLQGYYCFKYFTMSKFGSDRQAYMVVNRAGWFRMTLCNLRVWTWHISSFVTSVTGYTANMITITLVTPFQKLKINL